MYGLVNRAMEEMVLSGYASVATALGPIMGPVKSFEASACLPGRADERDGGGHGTRALEPLPARVS